jgi:hypothetical protein
MIVNKFESNNVKVIHTLIYDSLMSIYNLRMSNFDFIESIYAPHKST